MNNLLPGLRLFDLLDVALVAAFLYALLGGLQSAASRGTVRRAAALTAVLAVLYGVALFLDLYLVAQLLEALALVGLVAGAVVFQAEIRRAVDRIASLGRRGAVIERSSLVDLLVEVAQKMSEARIGALIALRGREPWERLIDGGVPLQGRPSLPLLLSIFDPDTPGHDGAVLIEDGQITRFAAHLPLPRQLPDASRYGGTRHAAAVGLTEGCDALVLVVSEETGRVSVAEAGQLEPVSTVELAACLERYWQLHHSGAATAPTVIWRRRMGRAAIAFLLAAIGWAAIAYRPATIYRTLTVPLALRGAQATWELVETDPTEVRVTLAGNERAFERLDPTALEATLSLERLEEGYNEFVLAEDNFDLPSGLHLRRVNPSTVVVEAQRLHAVRVPIEVRTAGALPDSLRLVAFRLRPESVTLLVERYDQRPARIPTEPIDLTRITASGPVQTRVVPPEGTRLPPDTTAAVTVTVQVAPAR